MNFFENDEAEEKARREWQLGDYDNGDTGCPNCGRFRLCICPNGKHRCEKFNWSPEINGHAPTTVMRTGTTMAIAETTGFGRDSSECAPDAAYIAAANPAVILKLLAMLEAKMENNDAK
jgi:hypothetical protein